MALQVVQKPQGLPITPLQVRQAPLGVQTSLGMAQAPQQQISQTLQAPAQQPQFNGVQPLTPQPQISGVTGTTPAQLDDAHRQQLDGIVMQMAQKNAPKEAVQAVVSDFQSKYGQSAAQPEQVQQDPGVGGIAGVGLGATKGAL